MKIVVSPEPEYRFRHRDDFWGDGMTMLRGCVATFVALIVLIGSAGCNPTPQSTQSASRLPTILRSGKIRCSYLLYPPYVQKDPNTGKLTGVFYDLMNEVGRNAGLEVDWTEEIGYEAIFTNVNSGRSDLFCGGLWPNSARAREGTFSVPVFYSVIKAWGRTGETRFKNLQGIDSPSVRIAVIDGAMEDIIARADYPRSQRISLPQLSPFTQNFLNITSGKADVTFAEPGIALGYLKSNPNSIQELAPDKPLRTFGNTVVIPKGDYQLKEFVDVALLELLQSGRVDAILKRYEPAPGVFPRAALPYDPTTAVLQAPR